MENHRQRSTKTGGSYVLVIRLGRDTELRCGSLGRHRMRRGIYLYVGSARRGIEPRVLRHLRLAQAKSGCRRWHVDSLLNSPHASIPCAVAIPGSRECDVSKSIAALPETSVAVPRFGSTDCRSGCPSHLYRIETDATQAIECLVENLADHFPGAYPISTDTFRQPI